MNNFRFDDQSETVYEYNNTQEAYLYLCSYHAADIQKSMTDQKKHSLAQEFNSIPNGWGGVDYE